MRDVFTVDGKVLGVPALVDNLAVVYNKTLFAAAGLPEPPPDWTWDELVADAKKLTDPGKKQFGLEFPIDGSETEVWKYIAMLWEAQAATSSTPDGTKAAFASPAGRDGADRRSASSRKAKALYLNAAPGQPEGGAALQRRQDRHVHHGAVGSLRRSPMRSTACR